MRALVTGATSGIGLEFTRQLAAKGLDLVLVARSQDRLGVVAAEVAERYDVRVEVMAADLTQPDDLQRVCRRLASPEPADLVSVLVNNAGSGAYGRFTDLNAESDSSQIDLNVRALVELCRAAIPAMERGGRGWIVNMSSTSSAQPMPFNATYGGTKAFVTSFSLALSEELRGSGVRVLVVQPGYTRTEFHERAGVSDSSTPEFMWMDSATVVRLALRDLTRGRAVSTPGLMNRLTTLAARLSPPSLSARISAQLSQRFQ